MDSTNTVCPVCTLFLRPGITLKQHLSSHPKQKVIEALVRLAGVETDLKCSAAASQHDINVPGSSQINTNPTWNQPGIGQIAAAPPPPPLSQSPVHGNHVFIYQQSMSTTSPQPNVLNVNPLSHQYVYPAVFNPQMMPYVYQQQQVIMSSNSLPPHPTIRALPSTAATTATALPFELPCPQHTDDQSKIEDNNETEESENRIIELQDNVPLPPGSPEKEDDTEGIGHISSPHESVVKKQEIEGINEVETMEDFEHQRLVLNDIPPEMFDSEAGKSDYNNTGTQFNPSHTDLNDHRQVDPEEILNLSSPKSNSDYRFPPELHKACQTQSTNITSPKSQIVDDEEDGLHDVPICDEEDHPEYFYLHQANHQYHQERNIYEHPQNIPYSNVKMNTESFEQAEPIYTSANILHGGDHLDIGMDDLVVINSYSGDQVISQVEDFGNTSPERPGVLMTIGDIPCHQKVDYTEQRDLEEASRSSSHVNIRSDERMPPRGELSGQESVSGSSDLTWNRLQYQEGSSKMYDLIGRDSWDTSDSDSVDNPSAHKEMPVLRPYNQEPYRYDDGDKPKVIGYSGPPLPFKCSTCGKDFANSKERKEHELADHSDKFKMIGADIGKKKSKKLIVKFKTDNSENENNFDNIFTNKLKIEMPGEMPTTDVLVDNIKIDESPVEIKDLKTVCPICDFVVENAKALRIHKIEAHNEVSTVRHKCLTCGESFTNEYKYTIHLKIHPLECRLCGKLFYRKQNIQLHMKRHLGLKPFKCDICEKSFVTRQKLDEHRNIHTGDTPLKCSLCEEKFRRHSNLVQHRNRHHFQLKKKLKDYICQCGEIFHSKKKLAWHKEIHDSKPKACAHCSEKFLHMSSLTRHMRRAHNDKYLPEENRQNENVECPICKGTYLKSSLDIHIRNHSGQRPYTCLICNKDFTTKWNLKLHKWTHASRTAKPFKCDQCKGAFIRESDYTAHMNSHKSVRPYTCNYCGAQFIRKYNCLRHVKEHENDKTFNCTVCGKAFHRSYYLKDHMRVHSGVRPYTCHICGKTSTTKSNHNKHIQIHHAREPVSTEN